MRSTSIFVALISATFVAYVSAVKPNFVKLRQVFDIRIINNSNIKGVFNEKHGFNFSADESFCEEAAKFARIYFDKKNTIGDIHPYKIIFKDDQIRTSDVNMVMCPGVDDTACFVRKMTENGNNYKVYIRRQEKLSVFASTNEVDRLYNEFETGDSSSK